MVLFGHNVFYYCLGEYLNENSSIVSENKFSLLLFVVTLIGLAVFCLFVYIYITQTIKILCKIKVQLVEVEDNCVLAKRDTSSITDITMERLGFEKKQIFQS